MRVTAKGFDHDRLVMIINKNKVPITQRMIPELATVSVKLFKDTGILVIEPPKKVKLDALDIYLNDMEGDEYPVALHTLPATCIDCGEDAANWVDTLLSALTNKPKAGYRLVRIKEGKSRGMYGTPCKYDSYQFRYSLYNF